MILVQSDLSLGETIVHIEKAGRGSPFFDIRIRCRTSALLFFFGFFKRFCKKIDAGSIEID